MSTLQENVEAARQALIDAEAALYEEQNTTYSAGDLFTTHGARRIPNAMLCQVGSMEYCLVHLRSGNRLQEPKRFPTHNLTINDIRTLTLSKVRPITTTLEDYVK